MSFKSNILKITIYPGNAMVSFLKIRKNKLRLILNYFAYLSLLMFYFWPLNYYFLMVLEILNILKIFILLAFIYSNFMFKVWKKLKIFQDFLFQCLNSKLWYLKFMILNSLVCCSIPSIGLVWKDSNWKTSYVKLAKSRLEAW